MTRTQIEQLQHQHRNGASIQALVQFSVGFAPQWVDVAEPMWKGCTEYRIKPAVEKSR